MRNFSKVSILQGFLLLLIFFHPNACKLNSGPQNKGSFLFFFGPFAYSPLSKHPPPGFFPSFPVLKWGEVTDWLLELKIVTFNPEQRGESSSDIWLPFHSAGGSTGGSLAGYRGAVVAHRAAVGAVADGVGHCLPSALPPHIPPMVVA